MDDRQSFVTAHRTDVNAEMARPLEICDELNASVKIISKVRLPKTAAGSQWDVHVQDGLVSDIREHRETEQISAEAIDGHGALLAPSLCHPHIHLDKAFVLSHPKYDNLQMAKGDFQEAMSLTNQAKAQFEHADLLDRGQRLIDESVAAGVTHMRAFVEVDAGVGRKCLDAGIALRQRAEHQRTCDIQICAFAQLPLFSATRDDNDGEIIRHLMQQSATNEAVHAIGSTPYVETDRELMEKNVEWMVDMSIRSNRHLDFHLDYNLDPNVEPLVWHVINTLKDKKWKDRTQGRTVVLGHCTRLALWDDEQWRKLASEISEAELPISFVGLPTSDLFMMRTGKSPEVRGTLSIPKLISEYGLNASISVNNVGNAFTPQGSCDPLALASQCVGIYQAGTKQDTQLLYECISTRAKSAIGMLHPDISTADLSIRRGSPADLVLFPCVPGKQAWRTCKSVDDAVFQYHSSGRRTISAGMLRP